jgi:N-acyl-D-aspartate/D-glutamate deacylase
MLRTQQQPGIILKNKNLMRAAASALAICAFATILLVRRGGAAPGPQSPFDIVITGGHILDGTGGPWFAGDVAIKDGKIAEIGRLGSVSAKRVIDAKGLVVAPGFIDMHTHSDFTLLADGKGESKIRDGVTTEILGEAESAGPVMGPAVEGIDRELHSMGVTRDWTTLGEYFARVERSGISPNVASYVGTGQVRMAVAGNVNRAVTAEELEKEKQLVEQAMQDGAIGISSGLIYPPNSYMSTDELVALAKIAARAGGVYASHIRGEGNTGDAALDEAIAIGERAGLPVHIFHFKVSGAANWGKMKERIARVQAARDRGIDVTANQYPYVASMTGLGMVLPPKFLEGTTAERVARLRDPKSRAELHEIMEGRPGWETSWRNTQGGAHGVMVATVFKPENKKYEGKRMDDVAKMMGKDPVDAVADLLADEEMAPYAVYFIMNDADVKLAMQQPWLGIGSDGSAVSTEMAFMGHPHPRFYGTFSRVLGHYVRVEKTLPLAEAVRKMTSLPAEVNGLSDRGVLRPGMAADITVFNADTISDKATFEDPLHYSEGVEYVVVNGVLVVDRGKHTGAKPGRVLYGRGRVRKEGT